MCRAPKLLLVAKRYPKATDIWFMTDNNNTYINLQFSSIERFNLVFAYDLIHVIQFICGYHQLQVYI